MDILMTLTDNERFKVSKKAEVWECELELRSFTVNKSIPVNDKPL